MWSQIPERERQKERGGGWELFHYNYTITSGNTCLLLLNNDFLDRSPNRYTAFFPLFALNLMKRTPTWKRAHAVKLTDSQLYVDWSVREICSVMWLLATVARSYDTKVISWKQWKQGQTTRLTHNNPSTSLEFIPVNLFNLKAKILL